MPNTLREFGAGMPNTLLGDKQGKPNPGLHGARAERAREKTGSCYLPEPKHDYRGQ